MERKLRDFYEVMGVDKNADANEIRRRYKRCALELHPDKNVGDPNADARFKELVHAYTILSDPEEREWYDSHKESILAGGDGRGDEGGDEPDFIDLYEFMTQKCFGGRFDEEHEKNFYSVYQEAFTRIAKEETEYSKGETVVSPPLGTSSSPYSEVAAFYNFWVSFQSKKTYAWKDEYKVNDMEERYQRRAADRHNMKQRGNARREWNRTFQELVQFVMSKDPRVAAERERREEEEVRRELERQERILEADAKRASQRAEWMKEQAAQETDDNELLWDMLRANEAHGKKGGSPVPAPAPPAPGSVVPMTEEQQAKQAVQDLLDQATEEPPLAAMKCTACKRQCKALKEWQEHIKSNKHKTKVKQLVKGGGNEAQIMQGTWGAGGDEKPHEKPTEGAAEPSPEDEAKQAEARYVRNSANASKKVVFDESQQSAAKAEDSSEESPTQSKFAVLTKKGKKKR